MHCKTAIQDVLVRAEIVFFHYFREKNDSTTDMSTAINREEQIFHLLLAISLTNCRFRPL